MSERQSLTITTAQLERTATARVLALQAAYLANSSRGRALMAELRRAIGQEPGMNPVIWELTQPELPFLPRGDAPTREENALHVALTLYAVHQQSRTRPMHATDVGLGRAAGVLIGFGENERPAVRDRFNAIVTASTFAELVRHLRSFIPLLRAEEIAIDYGMLAGDLLDFQRPGGSARIRRRWARQMFLQPTSDEEQPTLAATVDSDR